MGISYGHPLAAAPDPADGLVVYAPVALDPDVPLNADGARRIAEEALRWERRSYPAAGPGRMWAFSVAVRSQLDRGAQQPLLLLDQLLFQINPGR